LAEVESADIAVDVVKRTFIRDRYCCAEGFAFSRGRQLPQIFHADNGNA
jgi:hypothetical protein